MAFVNTFQAQLITTLLEDTTTVLTSPGEEETGAVAEVFGGFPMLVAAGASSVNVKLGTLTDPMWIAVFGDEGVSFSLTNGGVALKANPFAFLADVDDGLAISEIWVSNSDAVEHGVTILAVE